MLEESMSTVPFSFLWALIFTRFTLTIFFAFLNITIGVIFFTFTFSTNNFGTVASGNVSDVPSTMEMKQMTLDSFHPHLFYKGSDPSTCTLTDPNNPLLLPPPQPISQILAPVSISLFYNKPVKLKPHLNQSQATSIDLLLFCKGLMIEMDPSEGLKRGLDVNHLMLVAAANVAEEKVVISSPNSAVLMDFGIRNKSKRGNREVEVEAVETERTSTRAKDDDDNKSTPKKLRLSKKQSAFLEESFKEDSTFNPINPNIESKFPLLVSWFLL
ncbi:hypothetical protein CXB51_031174 [Gossypium anomalum]|uniref:Uncharacterized protein n=1 Tax=Gossypium anomalum TaxID=47600 RepID=A0A8J5Y0B4_9ROSI|nr:hypothetical protein CXB51_031174 [Gossypium anomalum]